ncbi:hypothetical protein SO802_016410 [Lithocarpus litseifolius]|uniref:DDE Tnp4 domain-containing protein n=1 Tax=Lithocarpus litseifolius TaxID=425828 RepID=A0AAW2CXW7_9ROSI
MVMSIQWDTTLPMAYIRSGQHLLKQFHLHEDKKKILFAKAQEASRKDVERAFGVLQARFAIVRGPARFFHSETLQDIMKACVILHNMIVEDERDVNEAMELDYEKIDDNLTIQLSWEHTNTFTEFIETH